MFDLNTLSRESKCFDFVSGKTLKRLSVALTAIMALCLSVQADDAARNPDISSGQESGRVGVQGHVYPAEFHQDKYWLSGTFPGTLLFGFLGEPREAKGLRLVLELPEGIECIGAAPVLSGRTDATTPAESMTVEPLPGQAGKKVVILIDAGIVRRLKPDGQSWQNYERVWLRSLTEGGTGGTIRWRLEADGYEGKTQSISLKITDPILPPRVRPAHFQNLIAYLSQTTAPFPAVRDAYLDFWASLSAQPITFDLFRWGSLPAALQHTVTSRFDMVLLVASDAETPRLFGDTAENGFPPLLGKDGKPPNPRSISPWYLIDDPEGKAWEEAFVRNLRERLAAIPNARAVCIDFEPGWDHGYSEENRKAFQAFAELTTVPSVEECTHGLRDRWFDFRLDQHQRVIAKYGATMRKHFPEIPSWLCSDPLHTGTIRISAWCCVDIQRSDGDIDLHAPMPYYAGLKFFEDLEYNRKSLKKPVFPLIDPGELLEMFTKRYTPEKVKQNIVAAAALGCVGMGFWPDDSSLDGRYLCAISSGFGLVGEADRYYAGSCVDARLRLIPENVLRSRFEDRGTPIEVMSPSFDKTTKMKLHETGGDYLITIFNYDEQADVIATVAIPGFTAGSCSVTDVGAALGYTRTDGEPLGPDDVRDGFLVRVQPNGIALIEIANRPGLKARGEISQETLQAQLQKQLTTLKANDASPSKVGKTSSVAWGFLEGAHTPKLLLTLSAQKASIYIDPAAGANVVGWLTGQGTPRDLLYHKSRGFLGDIVLYDSDQKPAPYPFALKDIDILDESPRATFIYEVPPFDGANPVPNPLEGLLIEKTLSLTPDGNSIECRYRLTNRSPRKTPMKVGFRVRNDPRIGGALAGALSLGKISRIEYDSGTGPAILSLSTGAETDNLRLSIPTKPAPWMASLKPLPYRSGSPMRIVAANDAGSATVELTPDPQHTVGFYCWWGFDGAFTLELLTNDILLPPGASMEYQYRILDMGITKEKD